MWELMNQIIVNWMACRLMRIFYQGNDQGGSSGGGGLYGKGTGSRWEGPGEDGQKARVVLLVGGGA